LVNQILFVSDVPRHQVRDEQIRERVPGGAQAPLSIGRSSQSVIAVANRYAAHRATPEISNFPQPRLRSEAKKVEE
jgi:hypothetical protein